MIGSPFLCKVLNICHLHRTSPCFSSLCSQRTSADVLRMADFKFSYKVSAVGLLVQGDILSRYLKYNTTIIIQLETNILNTAYTTLSDELHLQY